MKNNVVKFKIKSVENLSTFLKRFVSIDKSLLAEISNEFLVAKSNTADHASVKHSKVELANVLEPIEKLPMDMLKWPLMNINKFTDSFKQFNESDEIFMDINFEDGDEKVALETVLHTKELKIKFICQDMAMLTYISPDALKRIVKSVADAKVVEFPFPKEAFNKINSLCGLDNAEDHVKFRLTKDGKILMKGKSFEYHLLDVPVGNEIELTFKNKQFNYIDQEISMFHLCPGKMLVKSKDSETMIILGQQEG